MFGVAEKRAWNQVILKFIKSIKSQIRKVKIEGNFLTAVLISVLALNSCENHKSPSPLNYPETRIVDSVDTYFGTTVKDPYRWLEDDMSIECSNWVDSQNVVFNRYLERVIYRDSIKQRFTEIWNYERITHPFVKGDKVFYYKNDGLQNHSMLCINNWNMDGEEVVLDPNSFSTDGTSALSGIGISENGKYLAYSKSSAGSDWKEIFVKDIETGEMLQDHLKWVKFSGISWDDNGFYYSRYNEPEEGKELSQTNWYHQIYYHRPGTSQHQDEMIYKDENNPKQSHYTYLTDDNEYLIVAAYQSTSGNKLMVRKNEDKNGEFVTLVDHFENSNSIVGHIDGKFYIRTNYKAPNYRLVSASVESAALENWTDVIPESEHVLKEVALLDGHLLAHYLENVKSSIRVFELDGSEHSAFELPEMGTIQNISSSLTDSVGFVTLVNFVRPETVYKISISNGGLSLFKKPKIDFDSEKFTTKQVFYKSKDGTEIPMFLTHRKDLKPSKETPLFLFGYGGFNISYTPHFRTDRAVFLEQGGIYAVANIRGGGEYGTDWHDAGRQMKKQNVFDDFIAAAEYLIREGYTSKKKLAIHGRSNGGLLVGAVMTQRPDLAQVAVPKVGVLDMLRYHKFTIGYAWAKDYGTSDDSKEMFDYLNAYSPIHNVKPAEYPATIVMTADHDDRVVPAHSFKFISQLQSNQKGNLPVVIRIDKDAGHGSGKPISKQIDEFTDTWAFVMWELGMEWE